MLGFFLLLKTEVGTKTIFNITQKIVVPNLKYDQVSGHVLGTFEINNLHYHTDQFDISIGHLQAKNVFHLFSFTFTNEELWAENVVMTPHFIHVKKQPNLLAVPIKLAMQKIFIQNMQINGGKIIPAVIRFNLTIDHNKNLTNINLQHLIGKLGQQSIQGEAEIAFKDKKLSRLQANLASQTAKFFIKENEIIPEKFDWLLHIPDLKNFLPQAKGSISATGVMIGYLKPTIQGQFTAKDTIAPNLEMKKVAGKFLLDMKSDHSDSYLQLSVSDASFHKLKLNQFDMQAQGSLKQQDIEISAKNNDQMTSIYLKGKYEKPNWSAKVEQLNILNHKQKWHLQNPTFINVNQEEVTIEMLTLLANQSKISLYGNFPFAKGPSGHLEIKDFDLSFFNFIMPQDIRLTGKMNLTAIAHLKKTKILKINGDIKPGAVYYSLNNETQKNNFNGVNFSLQLEKKHLSSNFFVSLPEGQLSSEITLPNVDFHKDLKQQPLKGNLNLHLTKPKILESLIPAIRNISGEIKGKYNFQGQLGKPTLIGNLNFNQGSFQIPKLNLQVKNVNINANSHQGNISYHGSLQSGNGTLLINGQSKIVDNKIPLELNLSGNNILICNQPEIKILATPNMHLLLADKQLKLSGKILIPEANLHPHDFGNAESASDDIVFVQTDGKKIDNSNLKISSSIQLILGNKIYLNSRGIKGQVLGKMRIEDDPNKATVAYGQLWLQDGNYTIYGKTLQIDDGKLVFSGGPISNPGLNIKASRSIQTNSNSLFANTEKIKVGVSVTGTLKEPKTNLFSEPAGKNSADILSYLILGVPANSASPSNSQLLLHAADALNFGGSNKLLKIKDQLKKGLGLSELDIGTRSEIDTNTQETVQHTAFVLGKYLSPKFYIHYSLDLFDHTNTIKVRYLLNKFWTVQSIANSNGSGVDVLYTIER